MTPEELQALMLASGKGGGMATKDLAALSGREMGINPWMAGAGIAASALPLWQAYRLNKEAENYKDTNLVAPETEQIAAYTQRQAGNKQMSGYDSAIRDAENVRAAALAAAKRSGSASDYQRAAASANKIYSDSLANINARGAAEGQNRVATALGAKQRLGAEKMQSVMRNMATRQALEQASLQNLGSGYNSFINALTNSAVIKPLPKDKVTPETIKDANAPYFNSFAANSSSLSDKPMPPAYTATQANTPYVMAPPAEVPYTPTTDFFKKFYNPVTK